MPITDYLKRSQIYAQGLDPDDFDDDIPEPVREQQAPVLTPSPPKVSQLGSGFRSFLRETPATAAGLGVGTYVTGLAAPTGPLAPVLGIGAGLLTSAATKGLQNLLIDELPDNVSKSYKDSEQQDITQNPISSKIGGLAAGLPFLKVSPSELGQAGRAIINPFRSVNSSEAQLNALKNMLISGGTQAGIGVGQEVYNQKTLTPNIDPIDLLLNATAGGLMNSPTKLGQKIGMHGATANENPIDKKLMQRSIREGEIQAPAKEEPLPINAIQSEDNTGTLPNNVETEVGALRRIDQEEAIKKAEEDRLTKVEEANKKSLEEAQKIAEQYKQEDENVYKHYGLDEAKWNTIPDEEKSTLRNQYKEELDFSKNNLPEVPKPAKVEEVKPLPINTEAPLVNEPIAAQEESPLANPVIPNDAKVFRSEAQNPNLISRPQESTEGKKPTTFWADSFKKLGVLRNVEVKNDGRVYRNGKEVAGESFIRNGIKSVLSRVNPAKANLDTYPHEIIHPFIDDLQQFGSKSDKSLVDRGLKTIAESPAFNEWKSSLSKESIYHELPIEEQAKEFLTQKGGEDSVRRILSTDKKGDFRNFLSDFWSTVKHKFGKATHEDYARLISGKLINDHSFSAMTKGITEPHINGNGGARNQEDSQLEGYADKLNTEVNKRYEEKQKELAKQKSDFQRGDLLYTKSGKSVIFLGDSLPRNGRKMIWGQSVETGDKGSHYLDMLTPEPQARYQEIPAKLKMASDIGIDTNDPIQKQHIESSPVNPASLREMHSYFMRPELDKLKAIDSPESKLAVKSVNDFHENHAKYRGQLVNEFTRKVGDIVDLNSAVGAIKQPLNYIKNNTPEINEARDYFWNKQDKKETKPLSPKAQAIVDEVRSINKKVRDLAKSHSEQLGHDPERENPDYFANTIKHDVIKSKTENDKSINSQRFNKDFIDYRTKIKGQPEADAIKDLKEITDSFKGGLLVNNKSKSFGPLDKAAGFGIPRSWREENLLNSQTHYLDRVARRISYAESIQKNPEIEKAIEFFKGNKHMDAAMSTIAGTKYHEDSTITAMQNVVKSSMMGILSTANNLGTSPFMGWAHAKNPLAATINWTKSVAHIRENIADAFEAGRIRRNMSSLELGGTTEDVITSLKELASKEGINAVLNRGANIMSDINGKNWSEKITRGIDYGVGKINAVSFFEDILKGKETKQGKKFFEDFGEGIDLSKKELSKEDLSKIAGRFVDKTQGTYDERGLPRYATEGVGSSYLSLARWSLERSNNFLKYAITPALNGNYMPLFNSSLGVVFGSTLVNSLRPLITGRKDNIASFDEINEAKKQGHDVKMDLLYKTTALVSASGQTGMIGDITKAILDRTYGKNRPQAINNVLIEASSNLTGLISEFVKQGNDTGFTPSLVLSTISQALENNLQTYRIIEGYVSADKKEDIERTNKLRDLRVFNTLSGNKISDLGIDYGVNLEDLDTKKFKQTKDMQEAESLLPSLLKKAVDKSDGSVDKLKDNISRLKSNRYPTVPDIKKNAQQAEDYIRFLIDTQGKEEATKRVNDFLETNAINKAKTEGL